MFVLALGACVVTLPMALLAAVPPTASEPTAARQGVGRETSAGAATLFVDPQSAVAQWVSEHVDHELAPLLRERLVGQPQARWITDLDPASARSRVEDYVRAASAEHAVPVLVLYALPGRDCGGHSAGGVHDLPAYGDWIDAVVRAIGPSDALVVLEPDSLALQDCLSDDAVRERGQTLASAVRAIKAAAPHARVFLDGGHSGWHSARTQAARLRAAGVEHADGFATNVANYQWTEDEAAYGRRLRALLGDRLSQVIDTSRNGAGPLDDQWCDPPGRRLGPLPTLSPDSDGVAAYLWVKRPGQADGCAARPGSFLPEAAAALAGARAGSSS
jgi:endoglucanase